MLARVHQVAPPTTRSRVVTRYMSSVVVRKRSACGIAPPIGCNERCRAGELASERFGGALVPLSSEW
eukprot:1187930-Prymnesium_polylepis.1